MSFITRVTPLTSRLATASVGRTTTPALTVVASRSLSCTTKKEKGPVEATKDTLKKAERSASNAALKGLETGGTSTPLETSCHVLTGVEHAKDKIRETMGHTEQKAEAKGQELKGEAAQRAEQGKGKTEKTFNEAKEKASEAMG